MSQSINLSYDYRVEIIPHDLVVKHDGSQLHFSLQSMHSDPINDHFQLADIIGPIEPQANILGDGFQMLAQTAGTAESPVDVGRCPDNNLSYRIYEAEAAKRFYNYLVVEQSTGFTLFGFTSCHRFSGYFELNRIGHSATISVCLDGEGISPQFWETNRLESICVLQSSSLDDVYSEYCRYLNLQHPPRIGTFKPAPIGWCSWYAYYADVTEGDVDANIRCMDGELDVLEWVLLDDGYQAFMGDWLTPSDKFPSGVKELIAGIRERGKKPAIWLAPFIAQPESEIFKQHPDWFVRNTDGDLLKAEDATYGGWRCTPWYVLDTSHPEVQEHLMHVVSVMREEWGVELFKLDANYWGTLKGSRFQKGITGIEAYRLGMQAIAKGAGDAWLLGCNAPMWPSLGTVDAMRVSDDVERRPERFQQIARETFYRSWQHKKIWQIDPDCVTLTSLANQSTDRASYEFHRNVMLTCGGLLLSGDPLPELLGFAKQSLSKLIERQRINQQSAIFSSLSLNHAFLQLDEHRQLHSLFNYGKDEKEFTLTAEKPTDWYDFWSGEKLNSEPSAWLELTVCAGTSSRVVISSM
ncbi:glycosyl hydrolase [Vibrio sp. T187]|uniref:glycoside hydrolase family 36 protein n=1 Tax=Vibrio TaxID=662 RepID=UPI0010C9E1A1|nr:MULTISPECIES: alpha-galactosidase [Vibrio]MBW3694672.1 glycosyl hydrolase [Vibrio sp. T187]